MSFSPTIKQRTLVACGRHCCLCHKFCGIKIELHHILEKGSGGQDTFENCIPLCFDCHADMRSYDHMHPKGTKYTESELKEHRDAWYSKVKSSGGPTATPEHLEVDRTTFATIQILLPWNPPMNFIKNNNFAGFPFRTANVEPFFEFSRRCADPSFEFLDVDLEGVRLRLAESIDDLVRAIGKYTFATTESHITIPSEWEVEQPKQFEDAVTKVSGAADGVSGSYSELVRLGRRKLAVD